jgi:predicted enzyme related to lactoylglutathione lyase
MVSPANIFCVVVDIEGMAAGVKQSGGIVLRQSLMLPDGYRGVYCIDGVCTEY